MSKRRLDELDKKILECLYDDVRLSNRRVAAALDITEGTVRTRIARMQKEGLVRFTATLDASVFRHIGGIIGIDVTSDNIEPVCRELADLTQINFVGKMLGRYDILCTFMVHDNEELVALLQSTLPGISGVKSSDSLQVVQIFKFDRRWSVLGLKEEEST